MPTIATAMPARKSRVTAWRQKSQPASVTKIGARFASSVEFATDVKMIDQCHTPRGWQRLRDELRWLVNTERPAVTQVVSWAAALGDRSENADYIYGKKRLREIDRRIRYLTRRLEVAEVVDPATREETDQVFFG